MNEEATSAEQEQLLRSAAPAPRRYGSFQPPDDLARHRRNYTVAPGDTLAGIAVKFDTTIESLKILNKQLYFDFSIQPGDELHVPVLKDSERDNALELNDVNISSSIVREDSVSDFRFDAFKANSDEARSSRSVSSSPKQQPKKSMMDMLNKIDTDIARTKKNVQQISKNSSAQKPSW